MSLYPISEGRLILGEAQSRSDVVHNLQLGELNKKHNYAMDGTAAVIAMYHCVYLKEN